VEHLGLKVFCQCHVVGAATVVFAKFFEGELADELAVLVAADESALGDIDHFVCSYCAVG
jgi:hypothetical protein